MAAVIQQELVALAEVVAEAEAVALLTQELVVRQEQSTLVAGVVAVAPIKAAVRVVQV